MVYLRAGMPVFHVPYLFWEHMCNSNPIPSRPSLELSSHSQTGLCPEKVTKWMAIAYDLSSSSSITFVTNFHSIVIVKCMFGSEKARLRESMEGRPTCRIVALHQL